MRKRPLPWFFPLVAMAFVSSTYTSGSRAQTASPEATPAATSAATLSLETSTPVPLLGLADGVPVVALDPANFTVRRFRYGANRQPQVVDVVVKAMWEFGGRVYINEQETDRWYLGLRSESDTKLIEVTARFDNLDQMVRTLRYAPLPKPPAGYSIREIVRFDDFPVRLASTANGDTIYALMTNGDIWQVDRDTKKSQRVLKGDSYLTASSFYRVIQGLLLDKQGRLYIVANQRNETVVPRRNDVTIFRAQTVASEHRIEKPQPWFQTSYPWGIGAFNHGVSNIRFGPDGMLYVGSGSRTNGGEPGEDPLFSNEGETPITAAIWRLDPNADKPELEVYARGLRNPFGFAWNDAGQLFAVDHGPDADAPEEFNHVEQGKHYGFPYQFSNWTKSPYNYRTPPPGLKFTLPIPNIGPIEGTAEYPLSTFKPHAAPTGMTYLGNEFPAQHRGGFLLGRYGIQLGDRWAEQKHAGFDVIFVRVNKLKDGTYQARTWPFLRPVARPVDVLATAGGHIYVLEYSRSLRNQQYERNVPGRLLEISVDAKAK